MSQVLSLDTYRNRKIQEEIRIRQGVNLSKVNQVIQDVDPCYSIDQWMQTIQEKLLALPSQPLLSLLESDVDYRLFVPKGTAQGYGTVKQCMFNLRWLSQSYLERVDELRMLGDDLDHEVMQHFVVHVLVGSMDTTHPFEPATLEEAKGALQLDVVLGYTDWITVMLETADEMELPFQVAIEPDGNNVNYYVDIRLPETTHGIRIQFYPKAA